MIEVALASGFGSVRRFNETFQRLYYSARRANCGAAPPRIVGRPKSRSLLPYRPPYDWAAMIRFLEARAIAGLEVVTTDSYSRVIELDDVSGSITVAHAPEQSALRVTVRFPHSSALPTIIARIRRHVRSERRTGAIVDALSSRSDPGAARCGSARLCACPAAGTVSRSPSARCSASRSR